MDSHWTSKNNVDGLCNDQESKPVNIYNGLHTRAPEHYVFKEELEDNSSCEDTDFQSKPDLDGIHPMLHLVNDVNIQTEITEETHKLIEISKFTHNIQQNIAQANAHVAINNKDTEMLKKKKRNVAIESILEGISNECNLMSLEGNEFGYKNDQVKLLKPEDFVLKSESSQETEAKKCDIPSNSLITDASAFVFKKKLPNLIVRKNSPQCEAQIDAYQPSEMAETYYKKYLERSKFKERMQEATEEFYEKIKRNEDFGGVQLPYHRHMMVQDCIVCNIICRKFFQ